MSLLNVTSFSLFLCASWMAGCAKLPKAKPEATGPAIVPLATGPTGPDVKGCGLTFSFEAKGKNYQRVFVAGEFNEWKQDQDQLVDTDGDGIYTGHFSYPELKPGRYAYKYVVSSPTGVDWVLDNVNTRQKRLGDTVNSLVVVGDCRKPTWEYVSRQVGSGGGTIVARLVSGEANDSVDPAGVSAKTSTGTALSVEFDAATKLATVTLPSGDGKLGVHLTAASPYGDSKLYVPVWLNDQPFSFADSTMYFAFTDRFRNGDTSNDVSSACLPKSSNANWLGGDWQGITQAINEDYFTELGVDALWISPINDNPDGCYSGSLSRQYTSYHGYFPTSLDQVEERFGGDAALRELVDAAHKKGIRVLIDFVANHMHAESPLVNAQKEWFNSQYLCGWEQPLTCWFEPYLPDLNYTRDDVNERVLASAVGFVEKFDLDGFRFDAAKHIGHEFVHNLRAEMRDRVEHEPGDHFYMVGETFTGGWSPTDSSQVDMIKEWVGPNELSGQFDFPLWYEILYAFGKQSRGLSSLRTFLLANQNHYPADAVMSAFADNHDVPRFITHADNLVNAYTAMDDTSSDNAKNLGWSTPPGVAGRAEPYGLAVNAAAFLFAQHEVPLIYYGDEVGLPGAGDPDNRRLLSWSGLTDQQLALRDRYRRLGQLRKAHPALRSPKFVLSGLVPMEDGRNEDVLAMVKTSPTEKILVVLDRRFSGGTDTYPLWLPDDIPAGTRLLDLETAEEFTTSANQVMVTMGRPASRYLQVLP